METAKKILIIDDEKDIVALLSEFLASRGYQTTGCLGGEEGLKKFESENPDLVICDIKMPNMDGYEFLKKLRAHKRWVPAIIISALTEPANIMKGYSFEADYYITKPIDLENTLKAVEIMLSLAPLRKE